jgi:hypothetical protein
MTEETTTSLDDALAGETTQPQPEPATQGAPAEPVQDEPKPEGPSGGVDKDDGQIKVPLAALHEVRDANRALKQEMEALKASSQPAKEPEKAPDMFTDPEAYAAWQQRQTQAAVESVASQFEHRILNMSEAGATSRHGAETVEKAKEWALAQPASVQAEIRQQADPYEYAVQQHKKVELTSQLADPAMLEKFQAFLKGGEKAQAKPVPPTNTAVDQSVGARNPQWSGPTSLDDIFTN